MLCRKCHLDLLEPWKWLSWNMRIDISCVPNSLFYNLLYHECSADIWNIYYLSRNCEYKYYFTALTTEKRAEVKGMLLLTSGKKKRVFSYFLYWYDCIISFACFQRYSTLILNFSSYQGTILSGFIFLSFFPSCIKFVQRNEITEYLFNTEYNISLYWSSFTRFIKVLIISSWSLSHLCD